MLNQSEAIVQKFCPIWLPNSVIPAAAEALKRKARPDLRLSPF